MQKHLCFIAQIFLLLLTAIFSSCTSTENIALARDYYELGNSLLAEGKWEKAGQAYTKAKSIDPTLLSASYNLGRALAESGDYAGSIAIFESLLVNDPDNIKIISALAFTYYKEKNIKKAIEVYQRVLDKNPNAPEALHNMALLELGENRPQDAINRLEPLALSLPEDGKIALVLGRAYEEVGQTEKALASYEIAKVKAVADAPMLERMGQLYEKERRFSEAMEAYSEATKIDTKKATSWFSLARLSLSVAGDSPRGLAALKSALDAGFNDKTAAKALLDNPTLFSRLQVLELLQSKNLDK